MGMLFSIVSYSRPSLVIIASVSQFPVVLNVKTLVGAFNQEKALGGAFSVILKTDCETDGSFYITSNHGRCKPIFSNSKSCI